MEQEGCMMNVVFWLIEFVTFRMFRKVVVRVRENDVHTFREYVDREGRTVRIQIDYKPSFVPLVYGSERFKGPARDFSLGDPTIDAARLDLERLLKQKAAAEKKIDMDPCDDSSVEPWARVIERLDRKIEEKVDELKNLESDNEESRKASC
jgi:hypothetical protein